MNALRSHLPLVLTVPALLALAPAPDELGFHPKQDASAKKLLTLESEFRVVDAEFSMNGEPLPAEILDEMRSQSLIANLTVGVTEKFTSVRDGKPLDFLRTYDKIGFSVEVGDEAQDVEEAEAFEGRTVRFRWNDELKAFDKSFHESEGDADELADLIDDMELRVMLPDAQVSEGSTWSIPGSRLEPLFFPGGMPSLGGDEDVEGLEEISDEVERRLEQAFKDFKVECTYKGAREHAGRRVGEIAFTYTGKATLDLGDLIRRAAEAQSDGEVPEVDLQATATMGIDGEGRMLWDLAAGLLYSYEMEAEVKIQLSIEAQADQGGRSLDISISGELEGDLSWEMERED